MWHTSAILALMRLREEYGKFEASLDDKKKKEKKSTLGLIFP